MTKVVATKGNKAPCSIGKGRNGSGCGTVTIGGTAYADGIAESPYTYIPPVTYTATLKDGTEDAANWTITPSEGLVESNTVTLAYGGSMIVESVKATTKKAAAGVTAYTLAESTVGMIVGTDGNAYAVADKDNLPSGVTAAGMVAYKSGSSGLIIALADEGSMNWETAKSTCETKTPAFTGGTWKLPTQDEWKQMFSANGGNDASYSGLNTALATAGGDSSKLQDDYYWLSSEYDSGHAWLVYLSVGDASWYATYKSNDVRVRACLAFTVEQGGATYTLLSAATTADCGKVVCSDGHLHDAKTAVPDGCTAVGIIGKVTETGHGLILALQDATMQIWNTINGWASTTDYAGTTLKVLPDDAARGSLTSYTALGDTPVSNWAVGQKSDYETIFTNLGSTTGGSDGKTYDGNVNAYITTGVGGTAISGGYLSATELSGYDAWIFFSNYWSSEVKEDSDSVRPVLGFGGEATEEITVTPVEGKTNEWTFQMPDGDVKVEVAYLAVATATFDVDGETYAVTTNVIGEAVATPSEDPVKTGHTFAGWAPAVPDAMPASNTVHAATWTVNPYVITFTVDGETYAAITNDYGAAVTAPANPSKTGYTFAGWTPAVPETVPASNTTCVAGWTINSHSITFDLKGGEGEIDPVTLDYGAEYGELPVPVRTGYTFKGWVDEEGNEVTAETVLGDADVALAAKWEINQYTITFIVEGETYAAITGDYGTAVTAPKNPSKTGWTFAGWTPAVPETIPAENLILTAQWRLNEIDIPVVLGGGTNTTVTVTIGEAYTDAVIDEITKAAQATATRHGQAVAGWVNYDGSEVTGATIVSTNDVLSAVWETVNPLVPETKGEGAVDISKAQKYEAYILDSEGAMCGTVVVTVGKASKSTGLSSVKARMKFVGESKTYTFKATEAKGGKAAISTEAATEGVELYNKYLGTMVLDIGAEGVTGTLGEYEINGSRNTYKTDKAAYATWTGTWTAAIADADGAYSTFSVKVKKNGSVSVKGVASTGAMFSVMTRLMVADDGREACMAVKGNKKVPVGFTLWLGLDADGAACAESVESASGDAVAGEDAAAGKAAVADAETWTLSAGGEAIATLGWNGSRFSGDKTASAKVTYAKATGLFSGFYKAVTVTAKGRAKKTTVKFSGVFVDGVGYGVTTKGVVGLPVILSPATAK